VGDIFAIEGGVVDGLKLCCLVVWEMTRRMKNGLLHEEIVTSRYRSEGGGGTRRISVDVARNRVKRQITWSPGHGFTKDMAGQQNEDALANTAQCSSQMYLYIIYQPNHRMIQTRPDKPKPQLPNTPYPSHYTCKMSISSSSAPSTGCSTVSSNPRRRNS